MEHSMRMENQYDKWFIEKKWTDKDGKVVIKSVMVHLYDRLDGAYPHWWRNNFPDSDAIDNWMVSWVEAFEEAGVVPKDLNLGLKTCREKYDKPPSCAEFIKACKPSLDKMKAYYEAIYGLQERSRRNMGEWSHPAIYWAAVSIAYDLLTKTYSQMKDAWESSLESQLRKNKWEPIPKLEDVKLLLDAPKNYDKKRIKELNASTVIKNASDKTDHKLWAKRILERQRKGDKTLTAIQISFARDAISAPES